MKVFTVHEPAGLTGRGDAAARRVVFVKDGFSWPALLFPLIWLLYRRMWWVLLGFLAAATALFGLESWFEPSSSLVTMVYSVLLLLFALEANNLRRWHLRRRGYQMCAVVSGRDREECERKFFAEWLEEMPPPSRSTPPATPPRAVPRTTSGVIGMFPEPGGR